jgi:hypothetical protein
MLETILGVASSSGLGALIGAVSGYFTRKQEATRELARLEVELKHRELDIKEAEIERQHALDMADKKMEEAELEGDIAYEQADLANLRESIKQAGKSSGIGFVEGIKGLMRPVITLILMVQAEYLLWDMWMKLGGLDAFSPDAQVEMFKHLLYQMIFLTVTAVSWWFASRAPKLDNHKK